MDKKKSLDWLPVVIVASVILLFLLCLPSMARADEMEVWITGGMNSYHNDRSHNYRENNSGLGVELQYSRDASVHIGQYQNSFNRTANYVGYSWHPFHYEKWKFGILWIATSGYSFGCQNVGDHDKRCTAARGIIVAPIPEITYEYKSIGITIFIIPTEVTAVQLKFKL